MKSEYKAIEKLVVRSDERNFNNETDVLLGVSIDKCFILSVANTIGTDLTKYKLIRKNDFAVSLMQVSRDSRIPIARQKEYEVAMMSPAYSIFKVKNPNEILPEYLEMWFKRNEFDREAAFIAVGGVRGSMTWNGFAQMQVFLSKETIERSKLSELMIFSNGKSRPKTDGTIPVYGGNGVLSYTNQYNAENVILIGRVGAYCGSVYLEQGICWVSDNAIFAKSKVSKDEFFDYFLLKWLNLFNHHVGTGQQLLTQEILNNIEVIKPDIQQVEIFNKKSKSVFEAISANRNEIVRLQELSGLLLSRLAVNY